MQQRENYVDYAKAIGIILVVYAHVAQGIYNSGIKMSVGLYKIIDSVIYSFHMPLFFFLSGLYFYPSFSKRGGVKLIKSKIDTIVYPYIIWSIIQGFIQASLSGHTNKGVEYADLLSILWSPIAQFWFLYALFAFFCMATVIFSVISKKAVLTVFILSSVVYIYPAFLQLPNDYLFIPQGFVFFMFGIVFSLYFNIKYLSHTLSVCFFTSLFILCQFLFHHTLGLSFTDKGIALLMLTLVSILFVISLSSWIAKTPNKLLVIIGQSSMVIYLSHILAGSGVRMALKTLLEIDSFGIHVLAGCLTGLFAPILFLIIIKKLKIPYIFSAPISNPVAFLRNRVRA